MSTTEEPTYYEAGKKVVDEVTESVSTFLGGEPPESEMHKAGRETAEKAVENSTEAYNASRDYVVENSTNAYNATAEYLSEVGDGVAKTTNETIAAGQEYAAGVSSVFTPAEKE